MCTLIEIEQECNASEIAMIISGLNPDIRLSENHKAILQIAKQRTSSEARRMIESIHDKNDDEIHGCYLTKAKSISGSSKTRQTAETKAWISRIFAENMNKQ